METRLAHALVRSAAELAHDARFDIIEAVCGKSGIALDPPALPHSTNWWRTKASFPTRLDADAALTWAESAVALLDFVDTPSLIIWPAGLQYIQDAAARLAMRTKAQSMGWVKSLSWKGNALLASRSGWGGRVSLQFQCAAERMVACWRPAEIMASSVTLPVSIPTPQVFNCTPDWKPPADTTPEPSSDSLRALEGAPVVVSGGRGLGEAGFAALTSIAEKLGAALGGSLPAVDSGWIPVARQIGLSGKFVAPRVYFAVGISGTPQHLAGISISSRIIAVNKDETAPIFKVAEIGVIAEWEQLLPALTHEIETLTATV